MKKLLILSFIIIGCGIQVWAGDIEQPSVNMTPKSTFSGYQNTGTRPVYPKINTSRADAARTELMKPRSIHDMAGRKDYSTDKSMPMSYQQFNQNIDSSNMLYNQGLGALQNVQMGF